jgi:hypothetical protein
MCPSGHRVFRNSMSREAELGPKTRDQIHNRSRTRSDVIVSHALAKSDFVTCRHVKRRDGRSEVRGHTSAELLSFGAAKSGFYLLLSSGKSPFGLLFV